MVTLYTFLHPDMLTQIHPVMDKGFEVSKIFTYMLICMFEMGVEEQSYCKCQRGIRPNVV